MCACVCGNFLVPLQTQRILYMATIDDLYKEWRALQPLSADNQKRLDTKFMLEFNYNSNHIEGNTLTYGQTISLLIHGKVDGSAPMRDYEEMKAHQAALEMVKVEASEPERPLTEMFIRQVHKIMLRTDYTPEGKNYTVHAGIYKTRPNSVKTATGEIFEYASPEETSALMTDLVEWYTNAEKEVQMSPLEMAALFHYRCIRIHPFEDGNGRMARLLVNYILAKQGYPMIVVQESDRNGYLGALRQCDANTGLVPADGAHAEIAQITPLVEYLEKCLERALIISIKAAKGENIEEENDIQKRVAILARNAQAKRGDIKRISNQYVIEVYENFLLPFREKIIQKLTVFNPFYEALGARIMRQDTGVLTWGITKESLAQESVDGLKHNGLQITISMSRPTILIPANSVESANIHVSFEDEQYLIFIMGMGVRFRYGVMPTEAKQNEWIKQITEFFYSSIEQKVSAAK